MTDARTPPARRRNTPEKHNKDSPTKVLVGNDKCTARQKLLSLLGHPLEKKLEQERQRKYVLVNELNRLIQSVREKEAKLKELRVSLNVLNLQPITYNNEDTLKQRICQLENDRERVKKVTVEEKKILVTYHHVYENLQQEVSTINQALEQEEHAVAIGQAKVDKAIRVLGLAEAAADDTLGKLVEVEHATMEKKRAVELYEGMELKKDMEKFGCLSSRGQSRQTEREEGEAQSVNSDDQCYDTSAASECDVNLVKDMEPLSEALGYTDVQKLVNKVVLQRATKEQLTSEKTQYDEQIEREAKVLADLDLQYTKVKFSEKAAATRFDELIKQTEAKLSQEMNRVERLQASLKESQDLLHTVEQGVDSLYFRMSCVPVEGFPRAECSDRIEKLMEIRASLPTVLQSASMQTSDISGLDQDMFVSLLEKFCTMEMRNNKRPTSAPDAPQLSDEGEEGCPTRDEIKRQSIRLTEQQQSKKSRKVRKL